MGRSVVVTGASGGIGQAITAVLAAGGYDVIATTRCAEQAAAVVERAASAGRPVRAVLMDVAEPASVAAAFAEIAALTGGGAWAVVNNAGVAQPGTVRDVSDAAAARQLEVNLLGPARVVRAALPAMRARRDGRIVNISSVSGRVHLPFLGWYCASKAGLAALTDALRIEVAPLGVRVSLIEPGSFASGIWERSARALPTSDEELYARCHQRAWRQLAAAGSLPPPDPVAHAVARALSARRPRARYLVGRSARALAWGSAATPTPVADYVASVATGLRRPPAAALRQAWQARTQGWPPTRTRGRATGEEPARPDADGRAMRRSG